MKKFITTLVVLTSISSFAQITITDADMPSTNDTVRLSNTIDSWGIDPTETGANYLWDYSFLEPLTQTLDTFFAVTTTPFAYQFYFNNQILYPAHKATFARPGTEFDLFGTITMTEVFDYFKVETDRFSNVGFGSKINGIPASTRNIPIDTIYKFPLNYSDVYDSESEWLLNIPSVAAYGQSKYRTADVEGWGTLVTPFGTFQTLKVKMDISITDTMSIDSLGVNFSFPRPVATEYHWLAAGMKVPVLQINSTGGFVTSIVYQDSIRYGLLGELEQELEEPSIYPNPASERIYINSNGNYLIQSLKVIDLNGKLFINENSFNLPLATIDISNLANGIYLIELNTDKGIVHSKFTITR